MSGGDDGAVVPSRLRDKRPCVMFSFLNEIVMKTPHSKRLPIGDPGYSAELRKAIDHSWTKVVYDHALAYQEDRDQSPRSRRRKSTGSVTVTGGDRGAATR